MGASRPSLAQLTVLAVEDHPESLALLVTILELADAAVLAAPDAASAFELFRQRRPHIIVSDIGLPGEEGTSLLRRIRALESAEGRATPAIALTALPAGMAGIKEAGFQLQLPKPVDRARLVAAVAELTRPP